jgi:outer membrane protein assembly factor BamB
MHKWNKAEVGTITFPEAGLQLLTLHYPKGNNFAYFQFESDEAATSAPVSSSPTGAGDWPQSHGPNRDSICTETGLLQEWPKEGPKLLWKCIGLGNGYATVAIAHGRCFTTGDRTRAGGTNKYQYVMAFDFNTQSNRWITPIGLPGQNGACSTPTVDGALLYAISGDGNLVCVETDTGKERWRKSMTRDFDGKVMEQWKYSESPLVDGDKVVCCPGGKEATMGALNKKTGDLIWNCPRPNIACPENKLGAGYETGANLLKLTRAVL